MSIENKAVDMSVLSPISTVRPWVKAETAGRFTSFPPVFSRRGVLIKQEANVATWPLLSLLRQHYFNKDNEVRPKSDTISSNEILLLATNKMSETKNSLNEIS
jgi:hypothetical protein